MSLLFETVKILNNKMLNIDYHNSRVNRSRKELLNARDLWDLRSIAIPQLDIKHIHRCKIIYRKQIISVKFYPYFINPLHSLKLVDCPDLDYNYKYFDRSSLEIVTLSNKETDDIIIVQHGLITDCSYANIIFFDGEKWITPATPLLKGTKRQQYIDNNIIFEQEIKISDLKHFTKARVINAMIDLEESPDILMKNIF
jgi:4-amino-4-deoxychorismate lyase